MCFKVECSKCGKFTWSGCGKHVAAVHRSIDDGKHCTCKPWPGVDASKQEASTSKEKGEMQRLEFVHTDFAGSAAFGLEGA
ncbi:hypothetical protein ACP4OV_022893 [Aristida adscensionis]